MIIIYNVQHLDFRASHACHVMSFQSSCLSAASTPQAQRRGLRLQAMLATQSDSTLYFKLNLGAHRQGVVSREEALRNFEDMHYGEIADCWAWHLAFKEGYCG